MCLNDRSTDRKADTQPARLSAVEGIEQVIGALRVHPGAGVLHCNKDIAAGRLARADTQLPRSFVEPAHGLHSVRDEIQDDLLHLDWVSTDEWQALCEPRMH